MLSSSSDDDSSKGTVRRVSAVASLFVLLVAASLTGCGAESDDPEISVTTRNVKLTPAKQIGRAMFLESPGIDLDWSEGTVSALVYAESTAKDLAGEMLFVSEVVDPDGKPVVLVDGQELLQNPFLFGPPLRPLYLAPGGTAHLVMPQSDRAGLKKGKYTFRLATPYPHDGSKSSGARVRVVRRLGEVGERGTLDLNLFFVSGSGLKSDDMPALEPALERIFEAFSAVGIGRGDIASHDIRVDDAVVVSATNLSSGSPLRKLMTKSQEADSRRAINLFFVRSIDGNAGGSILGMSLGIPGALAIPGTTSSGVVLSVSGHRTEDGIAIPMLGATMAHEIGHAMGLFHTSEALAGHGNDLIDDTPKCLAGHDTNGDRVLIPSECEDGENMMFWTGNGAAGFTPGQGLVLRHAAVVRPQ